MPIMKKKLPKWTTRLLVIGGAAFALWFFSRIVMEVVDVQYTMNAISNLKAFGKPLAEYQKEHGKFPQASTMEELQEILDIHGYPFKKSNPPLHEIQYSPAVTQERPYLCYWESNKKWGIFNFLLRKHKRHQTVLMWEDFTVVWSLQKLDECIKTERKYLARQKEHRYKKK